MGDSGATIDAIIVRLAAPVHTNMGEKATPFPSSSYTVAAIRHGSTGDREQREPTGRRETLVFASGISGAMVPLTLKRLGADPATASSIFLTTATDVVSMGLLLGLASVLIR